MPATKKKKIPLPWATEIDQRLEIATEHFWNLSMAWNGFCGKGSTIGTALTDCNEILQTVGPERLVAKHTEKLKNAIVIHGTKSRMEKHDRLHKEMSNENQPAKMIIL